MVPRLVALAALLLTSTAFAAPITADDLHRHVEILAGDDYEGRKPGTAGEDKTIAYIADRLEALGLEPAAGKGSWYQPVPLVVRKPTGQTTRWTARGASLALDMDDLALSGRDAQEKVERAPVVFAGHGAVIPKHGIDQLAGAPIEGAVVLILLDGPDLEGFPSFTQRVKAVAERGAAAVIGIVGANMRWRAMREAYGDERTRLQSDLPAPVQGVMSQEAATRLLGAAGMKLDELLNGATGPAFRSVALPIRADLEVRTEVRPFVSNNVVGRLKGRDKTGQSVLFLAHWDHFGLCRPESAPDRICNGAVDNASGIAAMLEIARGLAEGRRPKRDILFLATTAEEVGLLGAEHFAANPVVPLQSIVAALNLDTVAISPPGRSVAVIGRGYPEIDRLIDETVRDSGRRLDTDHEADDFIRRQDGWKLREKGVPAIMVGGSFSDMGELGRFLSGPYHQPSDDLKRPIELGGAAEDAELQVRLARKLADPKRYQAQAEAASVARQ